MSAYAARARPSFDALLTLHSGASRPSYAVAHMMWLKIVSGSAWELHVHNGTTDMLIGTFNPITGTFVLNSLALGFPTAAVARNDVTSLTLINGRIVASQEVEGQAQIALRGKLSGDGDAAAIRWSNGVTGAQQFKMLAQGTAALRLLDGADAEALKLLATGDVESALWGKLAEQIVPPGTIIFGPWTSAPAGFIVANGALLSRVTDARLWASAQARGKLVAEATWSAGAYGAFSTGDLSTTFRIPHIDGYFLRGVSDEITYAIGTYRADANKSHTHGMESAGSHAHGYNRSYNNNVINFYGEAYPNHANSGEYGSNTAVAGDHDHLVIADGAAEAEPRNMPMLACIKR